MTTAPSSPGQAAGLPAGQLTVELKRNAGEVAISDARVQRILLNLLENARRHGGGGRVRLVGRSRATGGRPRRVPRSRYATCPPKDEVAAGSRGLR